MVKVTIYTNAQFTQTHTQYMVRKLHGSADPVCGFSGITGDCAPVSLTHRQRWRGGVGGEGEALSGAVAGAGAPIV